MNRSYLQRMLAWTIEFSSRYHKALEPIQQNQSWLQSRGAVAKWSVVCIGEQNKQKSEDPRYAPSAWAIFKKVEYNLTMHVKIIFIILIFAWCHLELVTLRLAGSTIAVNILLEQNSTWPE